MKRDLTPLFQLVETFYKLAGVITVPPELLKEVEDWAIGYYASQIERAFDKKIEPQRARILNLASAENNLKYWKQGLELMEKFAWRGDQESFNEFYTWSNKQTRPSIPYFRDTHADKKTGHNGLLSGVYESIGKPQLLSIWVYKYPDVDKINYGISIPQTDHPLFEEGLITPVNIEKTGGTGTIAELKEVYKEHLQSIREILHGYERAIKWYETYDPETMTGLYVQKKKFKRLSDNYGSGHDNPKQFSFSASSLPYLKDIAPELETLTFRARFEIYRVVTDRVGDWSQSNPDKYSPVGYLGTINLYYHPSEYLKDDANEYDITKLITAIKDTVRHELIHLIQTAIARIKKLKELGGLPSKRLRDKGVDYSGRPIGPSGKETEEASYDKERVEHKLRDVEFYTRLSDTIHDFQRIVTYFPATLHRSVAKAWVGEIPFSAVEQEINAHMEQQYALSRQMAGPQGITTQQQQRLRDTYRSPLHYAKYLTADSFFAALRDQQPLKYQKAVKEFMKAIGL